MDPQKALFTVYLTAFSEVLLDALLVFLVHSKALSGFLLVEVVKLIQRGAFWLGEFLIKRFLVGSRVGIVRKSRLKIGRAHV